MALPLALLLIAAACGGDDTEATSDTGGTAGETSGTTEQTSGEPVEGGELRVAVAADASSLDPQTGPSGSDHQVLYPMFDTLVDFEPGTLEPRPGLAESWEFTDPSTLVLTLREGVVFHDGTPMDADAVVASFERFQEIGAHADLANVESFEATGPMEVTLNLTAPDSSLVLVLADRAGMVVSAAAAEAAGEAFGREPVGAGPFQLEEWRSGASISMVRFEEYWNPDAVYLDAITMRVIPDRQAAVNAVLSGEVDFSDNLDAADFERLQAEDDVSVSADVGLWVDMIYFNLSKPPLDDARVRRAINLAIDRETLMEGATSGLGEAAYTPMPSAHWAYDPASDGAYEHDIEQAKALMAEAGYADGVAIEAVMQATPTEVRRNEILKAQLAEIGIDYRLNPMDLNQGVSQYFEAQAFHAAQYAWSGRPDPGQTYFRLFAKESYQNPGKVELPGVEDLLLEAVATSDTEERAAVYAQVNEITIEEAPWAPLYFRQNVTAHSTEFTGYEPSLLGKPKVARMARVEE